MNCYCGCCHYIYHQQGEQRLSISLLILFLSALTRLSMKKINLICLPFAGGNKHSYRRFEEMSPPFLKVLPFEFPGRGLRMQEPLLENVHEMTDDIYRQVKDLLRQPYALYGHSLGGLIAYLLVRKIAREEQEPPLHLFITGTSGPADPVRGQLRRHLLSSEAFIREVRELEGSPEEVLQHDELLHYLEPILRADFKASELYQYEKEPALHLPITVITGTREDMKPEAIRLWQEETTEPVEFRRMPGTHFFINKYPYEIMQVISRKIINHTKVF